jgi:hypothetical protein
MNVLSSILLCYHPPGRSIGRLEQWSYICRMDPRCRPQAKNCHIWRARSISGTDWVPPKLLIYVIAVILSQYILIDDPAVDEVGLSSRSLKVLYNWYVARALVSSKCRPSVCSHAITQPWSDASVNTSCWGVVEKVLWSFHVLFWYSTIVVPE